MVFATLIDLQLPCLSFLYIFKANNNKCYEKKKRVKSESDNQIFHSETIFSVENGGKGANFSNAGIECCSGCDGCDKYDVCSE